MLEFNYSSTSDFQDFGRWIWQQSERFDSHAEASQFIAQSLYEEFIVNNEPLLALVRIFRLTYYDDMPQPLQYLLPEGEKFALSLTGTYGIEPNWRSRHLSRQHQVVPLSSVTVRHDVPMFANVLEQFGVDLDYLRENGMFGPGGYRGQFYIPDPLNSDALPSKRDFIQPYGIRTVMGFGGFMQGTEGHQCLYLLSTFPRVQVNEDGVRKFFSLQDYIGTALASRTSHRGIF